MRLIQIESWALEVIQRVELNQPNEDSRVELKREWIDPQKAARQIAAQANASRGDPILWLIGIDQLKGIIGINHNELANWCANVFTNFEGIAPNIIDMNIPYKGKTIVALFIETDRAPFIVNNPLFGTQNGGPIAYEVPWREGTSTRTATRSDLIRILMPIVDLPEVETLSSQIKLGKRDSYIWELQMELYFIPSIGNTIIIPFHRCLANAKLHPFENEINFEKISLAPPYRYLSGQVGSGFKMDSLMASHTQSELILEGPSRVILKAESWFVEIPVNLDNSNLDVTVRLFTVHNDRSIIISHHLRKDTEPVQNYIARWVK
jgi:hypothetical protein